MGVGVIIHDPLFDNLLKNNPAKADGFCRERHSCGAVLFRFPPFLVFVKTIYHLSFN
jgi:hypothetical protein